MFFIYVFLGVFAIFVFIRSNFLTQTKKTKSPKGSRLEKQDNAAVKYLPKGLGYFFKVAILSYQSSKRTAPLDTVYHELYQEFGSPKSKNRNSTFVINVFNSTIVDVKDYNSVISFMNNPNCINKVSRKTAEYLHRGSPKGIIFNDGDNAKELRRYTMKTLGRLGFGKHQKMSHVINEQLSDLLHDLENLRKTGGNKIQVEGLFNLSVINNIWCLIGGDKFHRDDQKFHTLVKSIHELLSFNLILILLLDYLPKSVLLFLDKFGAGYSNYFAATDNLIDYFLNFIEEKERRLDKENPVDFVEHFLLEIEKHQNDEKLKTLYNKDQFSVVLCDLFGAGMDTTSKFMECAFMFIALNPGVQIMLQQEIDSVIGNCLPSYADHKLSMPFTQATIMEIHRMANIVAGGTRVANNDFVIDNQHFKKGTLFGNNFFYFRMDESYWEDPDVFRPQRFLDADNNLIMDKMNHVFPFGIGPRACIGENVATYTIFSFFTGIFQNYSISRSSQTEILGLSKGFSLVNGAQPFHVNLISRQDI